jgi:hypothetical protein
MMKKESIITGALLILITYTLGLSLVSQAFPASQTSKTLSSTGSIQIQTTVGIGVYSNSQCTTPLTSMSWGTLEPGGTQNVVCYIKNEGSLPTTLSMYASNWDPESLATSNYLVLSWNYDSNPISPDAAVQITFTLSVSSDITGITTFSFDITIVGSS